LLDISETGARLVLSEGLAKGEEVSVTLEAPASGRRVQRAANVIWSVPTADSSACAGLHFHKPLRFADLDHLAKA
jgi:hypothetical protein